MGHLGQRSELCLSPGPGRPSPGGPSRSGAPRGPAALWPGLPEAKLLRRLLPPPGPRQLKAPVQGGSTAHSAKHLQNLPPAWEPAPSGTRGSLPLWPFVCPQHPRCPGTTPAELSLLHAPCLPTAHRTPLLSGRRPHAAAGRCLQTSSRHSPQRRPSCAALRLYLGKPGAEFQRSVKCEPQMYQNLLCSLNVTPNCFSRGTVG